MRLIPMRNAKPALAAEDKRFCRRCGAPAFLPPEGPAAARFSGNFSRSVFSPHAAGTNTRIGRLLATGIAGAIAFRYCQQRARARVRVPSLSTRPSEPPGSVEGRNNNNKYGETAKDRAVPGTAFCDKQDGCTGLMYTGTANMAHWIKGPH